MLKRTPLKPKKFYTLKKSPVKVKRSSVFNTTTITQEFIDRVMELYNQGKDSYWIISKELECSSSIVKKVLVSKGIVNGNIKEKPLKKINEVVLNHEEIKCYDIINYLQKHKWKEVRRYGLLLFSKLVKVRANFKCELCGKPGTDAHHWYYTKAHNSMTDIMSTNGICLCRNCHIKAHNKVAEYKDKIKSLKRFQSSPAILEKVVNLPVDFEYVREILIKNSSDLREFYKRNFFGKDAIIEALINVDYSEKSEE